MTSTNEPDLEQRAMVGPVGTSRVRVATEHDRDRWNEFVGRSGAPALNRFEWAAVLGATYGIETRFLIAEDDRGTVSGVLGLYESRPLRGRPRVYSTRYGLVAEDDAVADALVARSHELFPADRVGDVIITSGYRRHDLIAPRERRVTLVLPLVDDDEGLWSGLRSKTRNMIRKSQRAGVEIRSGQEHLDDFCRIYERHMVAMDIPLHSREFFQHALEALGDDADLLVAVLDGEVIGGTLVLYAPGAAIYPYQTAAEAYLDRAPNQLMIWEAMRAAARRGIPRLDMGESRRGGSTYLFKHNFGGEDEDVHYYFPLRDADPGHGEDDRVDEGSRPAYAEAARKVLARLPFSASRSVYRFLRRHRRIV